MDKKVENLVLAIASKIYSPEGVNCILNKSQFIQPFASWRANKLERAAKGEEDYRSGGLFDDIMLFMTEKQFPELADVNIDNLRRRERVEIIDSYINKGREDLLADLVSRDVYLNELVSKIRIEMRTIPNRQLVAGLNAVKVMFLEYFKKESAIRFSFGGDLAAFVNTSVKYFLLSHRRDVYRIMNSKDPLVLETQSNAVRSIELEEVESSDIRIKPILENIHAASARMFSHSGHDPRVHGILSDIYCVVLALLCERKVEQINKALEIGKSKYKLSFIDVYSYRSDDDLDRLGLTPRSEINKSMGAKVQNAKDVINEILTRICDRSFSIEGLYDLCIKCFGTGNRDADGKSCVWNCNESKVTYWRIDSESIVNYETFDVILKGVISAHTLMSEMSKRGMSIVDGYQPELFRNPDIVRSVNYYSDRMYIKEIMALQNESVPAIGPAGLRSFDQLVTEVAGSENNGHEEIKASRRDAIYLGLLGPHRKKKKNDFNTVYKQTNSLAEVMTALPREYMEDNGAKNLVQAQKLVPLEFKVTLKYVAPRAYCNFKQNAYLIDKPEVGARLFYGDSGPSHVKDMKYEGWNVARSLQDALCMSWYSRQGWVKQLAIYNPMRRLYLMGQRLSPEQSAQYMDGRTSMLIADDIKEFNKCLNGSFGGSLCYSQANWVDAQLYLGIKEDTSVALEQTQHAMHFDTRIAMDNINGSTVMSRINAIDVYYQYRSAAKLYVYQLAELSRMQSSFIALTNIMFLEAIYGYRDDEQIPGYQDACQDLFESYLSIEFHQWSVNYMLSWIWDHYESAGRVFYTEVEGETSGSFEKRPLDMEVFEYLMGQCQWKGLDQVIKMDYGAEHIVSLRSEFDKLVGESDSPAVKYIKLYNFINDKLYFMRHLRDAFEILFCTSNLQISSYVCSLNSLVGVQSFFKDYFDGRPQIMAIIDGVAEEDMGFLIGECRGQAQTGYLEALSALNNYCRDCSSAISSLIDYDVVSGGAVSDELMHWGIGFKISGMLDGIQDLLPPSLIAADDTGFYRYHGSYFKAEMSDGTYYLHSTGRILCERDGKYMPKEVDPTRAEGKLLYKSIFDIGLR